MLTIFFLKLGWTGYVGGEQEGHPDTTQLDFRIIQVKTIILVDRILYPARERQESSFLQLMLLPKG